MTEWGAPPAFERSGRTLISTIVSLARAFGMTVIAEGVETEQQIGAGPPGESAGMTNSAA